jgi:undecaprenyl-diphosphatase
MVEWLDQLDKSIFLFLNGISSPFWDVVMFNISKKFIWIPLYALLLALLVKEYKWKSLLLLVFVVLTITLSDQSSVHLFKNVFERLRPCHQPELMGLVHTVNGKCGGQFGFVSSHAANSFALAGFFFMLLRAKMPYISWFLVIWAAVVAYSRVYLGVHFPGDILVGAILGFGLGLAMGKIAQGVLSMKLWKKNNT